MTEDIEIFIRPNQNYIYRTPFQTISIIQMSEDDQDDPDPTTPEPEPEPSDPTQLILTVYNDIQIETETVQLPVSFNNSTYNSSTIAKKTDSTYNILIGAGSFTNNNGYTWANYTLQYQNKWYATTIGDFTLQIFNFYNISIPYLSEDSDLTLGTDNINTLSIDSFQNVANLSTIPSTGYTTFTWDQTHTSYYYFVYDKTDDTVYYTDTQNTVQTDPQHELYYCDDTGVQGFCILKTTHGYISTGTGTNELLQQLGRIKITNASKYFPSVETL